MKKFIISFLAYLICFELCWFFIDFFGHSGVENFFSWDTQSTLVISILLLMCIDYGVKKFMEWRERKKASKKVTIEETNNIA